MEEDECPECPPEGLPQYMGTFADLMALLMCFFVLLLSFSEIDARRFKQIAGSVKYAFGVQNKLKFEDVPRGTSVIAMEFRPGKPEPTPIETIQQVTMDLTRPMLTFQEGEDANSGGRQKQRGTEKGGQTQQTADQVQSPQSVQAQSQDSQAERVQENMKKVQELIEREKVDSALDVENLGQQLKIRIKEQGSFAAGSAFLQPQFIPLVRKLGNLLGDMPGQIVVSGHTDATRVSNELYKSNWDLSVKRALAVAEALRVAPNFDESRMQVVGRAFTDPLTEGDDASALASNRRVEIDIIQGEPKESQPVALTGQQ